MDEVLTLESETELSVPTAELPAADAPSVRATDWRVERIDNATALEALADAWNQLGPQVPFLTHAWGVTWWRHYRRPLGELFVLVVRDAEGMVVGLAPWHCQKSAGRGRVVQFLGSGEVCADYLSLVARPGQELAVAAAIANWLAGPGAYQWDVLDFAGVDASDPALNHLHKRMSATGHATDLAMHCQSWRTELPATFEAFLAGLSRSRRETARTQMRKLVAPGRAVLRRAATADDIARAFQILVDLHQKRREMLDQPGCFASSQFTAFHRELAERLLAAGRLRLSWLELDGQPIAVEYSFIGGRTIYYYQGGFDPQFSQLGPGWLMTALSIRAGIDEGYRGFDFLRGDEPYKASWNARPTALVEMRIASRRPGARLRHAAWRTAQAMRRWAARCRMNVRQRKGAASACLATAGRWLAWALPGWSNLRGRRCSPAAGEGS